MKSRAGRPALLSGRKFDEEELGVFVFGGEGAEELEVGGGCFEVAEEPVFGVVWCAED